MSQIHIPVDISANEICREKSLGGAIGLCVKAAGFEHKEVLADLKLDKAQFSRWESDQEGVLWPKFTRLMDYCGNDAPLLWMLQNRGYDLHSIRKTETETERLLRLAQEENAALRRVLTGVKP